jgi:predicted phage terminase large subunit-like protein
VNAHWTPPTPEDQFPDELKALRDGAAALMDPATGAALLKQALWRLQARPNQLIPTLHPVTGELWAQALILAGRGFGKTRVGAEWLWQEAWNDPNSFNTVIAPTFGDVKFTCFEGESGLLRCIPAECIARYNKSDLIIELTQGAIIRGFSAEEPERFRGPQHHRVWADELAAWISDQDVWDMMQMGLRLGELPRVLVTTTPKPKKLIKALANDPKTLVVRGSTYDNRENLPATFFDALAKYEGTRLGDQELHAKILDDEGGIISRDWWRLWPATSHLPRFEFVIMSLDTAFTAATWDKKKQLADPTACTVWGTFEEKPGEWGIMLLDGWEARLGFPELLERVKREFGIRYGDEQDAPIVKPHPLHGPVSPKSNGRKADLILIEDKGSGISLRQTLQRERLPAHPYNPGRVDKLARLHAVSHLFSAGRVWVPESRKNLGRPMGFAEAVLSQVCAYKGAGSTDHDDMVDSTSQAIRFLSDNHFMPVTLTREEREDDDRAYDDEPVQNPYDA